MTKPQNLVDRPIQRHLDSRYFRENRLWRLCKDGVMRTELDGKLVTAKQFDKLHPPFNPLNFTWSRENSDPTNLYLLT